MQNHTADALILFNQLYREMDALYHLYARKHGLSDTTLWLMYSLYESGTAYTQTEFCALWHHPPQTINSALKSLEKQGLISLEALPENKKNKRIVLTARGQRLTREVDVYKRQACNR